MRFSNIRITTIHSLVVLILGMVFSYFKGMETKSTFIMLLIGILIYFLYRIKLYEIVVTNEYILFKKAYSSNVSIRFNELSEVRMEEVENNTFTNYVDLPMILSFKNGEVSTTNIALFYDGEFLDAIYSSCIDNNVRFDDSNVSMKVE